MRTLDTELSSTGQTVKLWVLCETEKGMVKFEICSDSIKQQCYAKSYVFDGEWKFIARISASEMKTKQGLIYDRVRGASDFQADLKKLKKRTKMILGLSSTVKNL